MTYKLGWSSWKKAEVSFSEEGEADNDPHDSMKATARARKQAFWYRNPVDVAEYLLSQPRFDKHTIYGPYKEFNSAQRRIYGEYHTGDWWWETQVDSA